MIKPITLAVVAVVATMGLLGGGYAVLRADEPTNHPGVEESRIGDCFAFLVEGVDADHPVADDHPIYDLLTQEKCAELEICWADRNGEDCPRLSE